MTVRTRKTITDLIQQLKAQEKEIKSQLSDGQRRLNEVRDRIATCYWIIEEVADIGTDDVVEEVWKGDFEELETISKEEWEDLVRSYPHLSYDELEGIVISQGFTPPLPYNECPCSDCSSSRKQAVPKAEGCGPDDDPEYYRLSQKDLQGWKETHPHLSDDQLERLIIENGWLMPLSTVEVCKPIKKIKAKAKKKISKKSTKKGKK
jgi:hypothetical protein